MTLEQFWRLNYLRMCRYCASVRYSADLRDIEEVVSDVIQDYFDIYEMKTNGDYDKMRHWMNRRALLDITRLWGYAYAKRIEYHPSVDAECSDDPMDICALKEAIERLCHHWGTRIGPDPIIVEYEPCRKGKGQNEAVSARQEKNDPLDRVRFCRERAKFIKALKC